MDEEKDTLSREEQEFMENIDWDHRLWPRAQDTGGIDGEWELTIRGTEEEFVAVHNLLVREGYLVDETGDYDVYIRKETIPLQE